ncbi:hypothetical protein ABZ942_41055 [Nocardia sp. NPDC046473]|uniref:hypothetical protein n=1 Tax=Nocardia sp. NPDC046473 TaxID=3155733 RepID=UPI0033D58441
MNEALLAVAAIVAMGTVGGVVAPAHAHVGGAVPALAHVQVVHQPGEEQSDEDESATGTGPTLSKVALAAGVYCGAYIRERHPDAAVVDSKGHGLIDNSMYIVQSDGTVDFDGDCHNCVTEHELLRSGKTGKPGVRCNY